jgi:hypothetical protein
VKASPLLCFVCRLHAKVNIYCFGSFATAAAIRERQIITTALFATCTRHSCQAAKAAANSTTTTPASAPTHALNHIERHWEGDACKADDFFFCPVLTVIGRATNHHNNTVHNRHASFMLGRKSCRKQNNNTTITRANSRVSAH